MLVKIFLTVEIDEEDYPMPTDGNVTEEVSSVMKELMFDVDGWSIKTIKTISE